MKRRPPTTNMVTTLFSQPTEVLRLIHMVGGEFTQWRAMARSTSKHTTISNKSIICILNSLVYLIKFFLMFGMLFALKTWNFYHRQRNTKQMLRRCVLCNIISVTLFIKKINIQNPEKVLKSGKKMVVEVHLLSFQSSDKTVVMRITWKNHFYI